MLFIVIVALIAFSIAAVSETFSIIGLSATFHSIYWSMVAMGVVLGAGKLASVSIVYRYWGIFSKKITIPFAVIAFVLTSISMAGHFGYLSSGYMSDSLGTKQVTTQIQVLEAEEQRKIARKIEIDAQVANLPDEYSGARIRLAKQFQDEQSSVTKRINDLDIQIADLKMKQIDAQAHTGPITFIASALGISTDDSVKWLIAMIVSVFDTSALWLTISVSAMLKHREEKSSEHEENIEQNVKKRARNKTDREQPLDVFELADEAERIVKPKPVLVPRFDMSVKHPFKD